MEKQTLEISKTEHYHKIINWVDGVPIAAYQRMLTSSGIQDLPVAVLSLPYQRTEEEIVNFTDEDFEGLSNGEVAMIRVARNAASGDQSALTLLLDRVLGKPKIQAEVKTLHLTYQDFLDGLAIKEGASAPDENDL